MPRKRKQLPNKEEEPKAKKPFVIKLESHREPIVQHIDSNGEEYLLTEPTPEQKFAEVLQRIDFSKTKDGQTDLQEIPQTTQPTKKSVNPLDLFRQAAGELDQVVSLLKLLQENKLVKLQQLSQQDIPKETVLKKNYQDLQQRREALLDASKRLHEYTSFARNRQSRSKERLKEALSLRDQWRIYGIQEQRFGDVRKWFAIDYSFQSIGSSIPASVVVTQSPSSTSVQVPERSLNNVIEFTVRRETNDCNYTLSYIPIRSHINSLEASGINDVNKLLDNAQFSLLYNDIFNYLIREARERKSRNAIPRENEVIISPNFEHSLNIKLRSTPKNTTKDESNLEQENNDEHSEIYFDMRLIHLSLLKLIYMKYQIQNHSKYYKTSIVDNGLVTPNQPDSPLPNISILEHCFGLFSHLVFRRDVDKMLQKIKEGFSVSGHDDKSSAIYGTHRSVKVHWIPTNSPSVSSVNVRLGAGCLIPITLFGTNAYFEDTTQSFTSADTLEDFLLLRFCRYILKQLQKEIKSQDHDVIGRSYSFSLPSILKQHGYQLEISIKPDNSENSLLKEIVTLSSCQKNSKYVELQISLACIPGCSYRSKIYYILKHDTPDWFFQLHQTMKK